MSEIHEALCRVVADIEAIGKDRRNEMQKFNFRGIDDVMNAVHPLFARHGIFCTPLVKHDNTEILETKNGGSATSVRLNCVYKFFAKDGSFIECEIPGEGRDSGDKATNKALSMAYKYVILQMLCIPTEETSAMDPDLTAPEEVKAPAKIDGQTQSQREFTARLIMKAATMKMESVAAALKYAEASAAELGTIGVEKVRAAICERVGKELKAEAGKAKFKAEMVDLQTEFMNPFHHLLTKEELTVMDTICVDIYKQLPAGDYV